MYQEFRPGRRLAPLVECGWARSGSRTGALRVIPDGCVDLFVSSAGDVMIAGPATTFYDLRAYQGCAHVGLRLRTGAAAAVVGRPVNELCDRQLPVYSVFGIGPHLLAETVLTATTPARRMAALQRLLSLIIASESTLTDSGSHKLSDPPANTPVRS